MTNVPASFDLSANNRRIERELLLIKLWTLISLGLLVATSYRIWLPPNQSDFPQVPFFNALAKASQLWDLIAFAGFALVHFLTFTLVVGQLISIRQRRESQKFCSLQRMSWALLILFGLGLVVLSQHRLQAWFYQAMLFALVFAGSPIAAGRIWLQRIVFSVYFYSALGKLDAEFIHTVGQDFLTAIVSRFGLDQHALGETDRTLAALALPIGELSLAIGLIFRRSRRWFGALACVFHIGLATLVQFELHHSWGVFLWNIQFAVQGILLFSVPQANRPLFSLSWTSTTPTLEPVQQDTTLSSNRSSLTLMRSRCVASIICVVLLMPLVERRGWWDHWPSWALYAPHSSRAQVSVAAYAVDKLPKSLRSLIAIDEDEQSGQVDLPLSQWSLQTLGVPIYPQARFQLGVARYLADELDLPLAIQVEIRESADRFTGARRNYLLPTSTEIEQASRRFVLGTRPRVQ